MDIFKAILKGESGRISSLGKQAQTLLVSYNVGELAAPVFDVFINVFLWRHFDGFIAPALYNLGRFVGLPAGFYLNSLLLRKLSSAKLYFAGTIAQSAATLGIILLSPRLLSTVFFAAVIYGIGNGIYWGNRNFLTLASIRDEGRNYFVALEAASSRIIGIAAPAAIGWFIQSSDIWGIYSVDIAYRSVGIGAFVLQVVSGYLVARLSYPTPEVGNVFLRRQGRTWNMMRRFAMIGGVFQGVNFFLGTFIVLALIGLEGEVGLVRGMSAFAAAALLYWIGRSEKVESRPKVLAFGVWTMLLGSLILAVFYSPWAAVAHIILGALGAALFFPSWSTIFYAAADAEGFAKLRYARIFDHEVFLNIGRAAGTLLFLGALLFLGHALTLRFLPLFVIALQFVSISLAWNIAGSEVASGSTPLVEGDVPGSNVQLSSLTWTSSYGVPTEYLTKWLSIQ